MISKQKTRISPPSSQVQTSSLQHPRSLRLRLVLWYSILLATVLIFFVVLVWRLTADALAQSADASVRAEVRVAGAALSRRLSPTPPYWPPAPLSLQIVDMYQDPGLVVRVIDAQGNIRDDSDKNNTVKLPLSADITRATLSGQTVWETIKVEHGRVRVEAVPIHAPTPTSPGATASTAQAGPIIGTLVVAKPLDNMDATLLLLRTLFLIAGLVALAIALLGGWAIAGRVLQPLAEIAKTARAIAMATAHGTRIGNLSRRVKRPGGRDEMAQVVDTFNEMLTNLEKATQAQRRFVADASHELRAPLTTIQGNLAFLNRHIDELPAEERHTMLADAHGETLRLAQLVEELLLLARADASADKLPAPTEQERVNNRDGHHQRILELDRVVLHLVRQFRGRLSGDETKVKLEVGHIEPLRVQGEEESIRRILLILLDNALKYTPMHENHGEGRIVISLERARDEAVIHVRDTGIGIDPDDLPHIFERFYRADRARSREGTGLGLAIAQTLVEQLHGRMTVESIPGQGSTFSVWLPLEK